MRRSRPRCSRTLDELGSQDRVKTIPERTSGETVVLKDNDSTVGSILEQGCEWARNQDVGVDHNHDLRKVASGPVAFAVEGGGSGAWGRSVTCLDNLSCWSLVNPQSTTNNVASSPSTRKESRSATAPGKNDASATV